jgi:hypothetical protein
MRRILLATVAACTLAPAVLPADGLIYQLPDDGTWAQYDLKFTMLRGDQRREATGTLRVASVGKASADGKDGRWIEFRLDLMLPDGNEQTIIAKVLVPEEQLVAGKTPIDHIARGWIKLGNDREPEALNDDNRGPLPIFLAGPGTDHKALDAAKIENAKLGEIEAAGDSGTIEYQEQTRKLAAKYETRRHEKAPFGLVSMSIEVESEQNGQRAADTNATLTLAETGDTALSDLPNQK